MVRHRWVFCYLLWTVQLLPLRLRSGLYPWLVSWGFLLPGSDVLGILFVTRILAIALPLQKSLLD
jgi:hypothetical protein